MEQRLINGWQPSTTMKPQNDDAGIENIQGVTNPFKSVYILEAKLKLYLLFYKHVLCPGMHLHTSTHGN